MKIIYSPEAIADLKKFPLQITQRIIKKMRWFSEQDDPIAFAKSLTGTMKGLYRFRIGDYRIVCDVAKKEVRILLVVRVKHRKEVYDL